jgi:hypothetical protein
MIGQTGEVGSVTKLYQHGKRLPAADEPSTKIVEKKMNHFCPNSGKIHFHSNNKPHIKVDFKMNLLSIVRTMH